MNYYERHLGDYAKDTAHLSILEHGVYNLLLDRYYATEEGIPAEQAYRIVRARTREEKFAVDTVLEEFFSLADSVWTNKRTERELRRYAEKSPRLEERKENEKERRRRSRERRKQLFKELSELGINMPWNTTIEQLQTELLRALSTIGHAGITEMETYDPAPETPPGSAPRAVPRTAPRTAPRTVPRTSPETSPGTVPGTAPVTPVTRDGTATHTPVTSNQKPVKGVTPAPVDVTGGGPATGGSACGDPPGFPLPLSPGRLCRKLKELGIADPNPGHAVLLELLAAGADETEFLGAAREARTRGKGFAYLIGTVRRRREEAAGLQLHRGRMPNRQERLEQANRTATAGWKPPELREKSA